MLCPKWQNSPGSKQNSRQSSRPAQALRRAQCGALPDTSAGALTLARKTTFVRSDSWGGEIYEPEIDPAEDPNYSPKNDHRLVQTLATREVGTKGWMLATKSAAKAFAYDAALIPSAVLTPAIKDNVAKLKELAKLCVGGLGGE